MALHVLDEANRCLGCKKPMCQQGCPIHTNIPEVIRLLKANELDAAGRMLFENNPLTIRCGQLPLLLQAVLPFTIFVMKAPNGILTLKTWKRR